MNIEQIKSLFIKYQERADILSLTCKEGCKKELILKEEPLSENGVILVCPSCGFKQEIPSFILKERYNFDESIHGDIEDAIMKNAGKSNRVILPSVVNAVANKHTGAPKGDIFKLVRPIMLEKGYLA